MTNLAITSRSTSAGVQYVGHVADLGDRQNLLRNILILDFPLVVPRPTDPFEQQRQSGTVGFPDIGHVDADTLTVGKQLLTLQQDSRRGLERQIGRKYCEREH